MKIRSYIAAITLLFSSFNAMSQSALNLPDIAYQDLSRGMLTDLNINLGLAFLVVGAWCIVGFIVTLLVINRRN